MMKTPGAPSLTHALTPAADLRTTQVVNEHKGVHVMLEKCYLQPAR
jgi:hypothetical protein